MDAGVAVEGDGLPRDHRRHSAVRERGDSGEAESRAEGPSQHLPHDDPVRARELSGTAWVCGADREDVERGCASSSWAYALRGRDQKTEMRELGSARGNPRY